LVQRRIEKLNPNVIPIVAAGEAKRKAAAGTNGVFQSIFVDRVDIEWGIGEDEPAISEELSSIVTSTEEESSSRRERATAVFEDRKRDSLQATRDRWQRRNSYNT
jgi:hypothetical protein